MNPNDFRGAELIVSAIDKNHVIRTTVRGIADALKLDVGAYADCTFLVTIIRKDNLVASKAMTATKYLNVMINSLLAALTH